MSIQRDIDAELRFHFDARIEELVAQGMTRDAARAQAIAEFGDVDHVRSALREIDHRVARRRRRVEIIDGVIQDVRYSIRALRRAPSVALTIIITLALGLGANAAMFSLLDAVFLKPPAGVARPDEIRRVWVERRFRDGMQYWPGFDYTQYEAVAQAVGDLAHVTMYRYPQRRALARGENAPTAMVTSAAFDYFDVMGQTRHWTLLLEGRRRAGAIDAGSGHLQCTVEACLRRNARCPRQNDLAEQRPLHDHRCRARRLPWHRTGRLRRVGAARTGGRARGRW